jgi:hypothetical protein
MSPLTATQRIQSLPSNASLRSGVRFCPRLSKTLARRPDVSSRQQRIAARQSGLASGLPLAVRPAGLAEVSGAQGRVLKIVSAKRLETIFRCP